MPPSGGSSSTQGGSGQTNGGSTNNGGSVSNGGSVNPGGGTTAQGGASGGAGGSVNPGGGTGGTVSTGEGPCPAGVLGHCDAGATAASYPTYDGYTLALVEDFPGPIDLDKDPIFTWSDGSPADGQTRFRKEQISFANGKMIIKAESPCAAQTVNSACIPGGGAKSYAEPDKGKTTSTLQDMGVWSGEFRTKYNNYRYGRYEAKFKAPTANPDITKGDFLSTMFIFRSPKWLTWNEIDLELEPNIGAKAAGNVVNATDRTTYPSDKNDAWQSALINGFKNTDSHVYAFTWTPTSVNWFVDGNPVQAFGGNGNLPIPNVSAKIMMNLWVFATNNFGEGSQNQYPMQSEYDYFRFYKWNQETTYPCANPPACLPAADKSPSAQNNGTEVNYGM